MANILRISEATSLALHTMALLAMHRGKRKSNLELAETLHASHHTLAKVLNSLARAELVDALRGPHGGFMLAEDPASISLLSVYEAVEGQLEEARCLLGSPICTGRGCVLGGLVESVHSDLETYLSETTVADLVSRIRLKRAKPAPASA
jgi:Rrf2 family protein